MASPMPTAPEKQKEPTTSAIKKALSTKSLGLLKAWEDSQKTKAENRANKKLSHLAAWEISKQAAIDAQQKKYEHKLEKTKARYVEKMQNKVAEIHKTADEKRAMVEAAKREECNKVEEKADTFRETGQLPKKVLPCFNCCIRI